MDNTYSNSYASLHTVKHDTTILDAQKILIRTPEDSVASRTDLIEYINNENDKAITLTNNLADSLNVYLSKQVYKSPAVGDGGIGGANILVAPANIFDPSLIYTHVMFQGSFADGYSDPVYLGMLLWDAEGNKSIVGVSEAFNPGSIEGNTILFSFGKNSFTIPADHRIIFYFLKSSEDIALDYPSYSGSVPKIMVSANKAIFDANARWNDAQTDINVGFHCDGGFNAGSAWDSWPVFSLLIDAHHSNGAHLTAEQLEKLNKLNLEEITGDHIPTYEKINELINNALSKDESTSSERFERPTGEGDQGYANAFNLGPDTIPHNVELNYLQIPILNGRSTETYLWLFEDDGSSKKVIGRSTNSNTWEDNATVTWYFDTFTIPDNKRLEVYFANEDQTPSNNEIGNPGYDARLLMVSGNKDSLRIGSSWKNRSYHIYLSFGFKSVVNYEDVIEQNKTNIANLQSEIQRIDNSLTELNGNIEDLEESTGNSLTELREYIESVEEAVTNNTIAEDINERLFGTYVEHADNNTFIFDWDAAAIPADQVPQDNISSIEIDVIDPISCELYLGIMCSSSPKPRFAVSTNSMPSGSSGKLKWEFDGFIPHEGHNLEIWLLNSSQVSTFLTGSGDPANPGSYIKSAGHNGGTHRYNNWWDSGNIKCTFGLHGELNNYVLKEEFQGTIEGIQGTIEEQITSINETVSDMHTGISAISAIISDVNTSIANLEDADVTINERIDYLDEQFRDNIQSSIENITNKINNNSNEIIISSTINATTEHEVQAFNISSRFVPQGFAIKKISIPALNDNPDRPVYIGCYSLPSGGTKTQLGLSKEPLTWQAGDEPTWEFETPFVISENKDFEIFFVDNPSNYGATSATTPTYNVIKVKCNDSGSGTIKTNNGWTTGNKVHTVLCKFISTGYYTAALPGDHSFKVTPILTSEGLFDHFDISSGNVYLENKQIVQIPAKKDLQMNSTLGESQYIVLNVFNNPNGTISYSYNAVNEDELIELGYTIVTPVEETIDLSN